MPSLLELIANYGDAWNRQDLDAICALHADGMVFENHNAGERAILKSNLSTNAKVL